jgi:hypothetical protein
MSPYSSRKSLKSMPYPSTTLRAGSTGLERIGNMGTSASEDPIFISFGGPQVHQHSGQALLYASLRDLSLDGCPLNPPQKTMRPR